MTQAVQPPGRKRFTTALSTPKADRWQVKLCKAGRQTLCLLEFQEESEKNVKTQEPRSRLAHTFLPSASLLPSCSSSYSYSCFFPPVSTAPGQLFGRRHRETDLTAAIMSGTRRDCRPAPAISAALQTAVPLWICGADWERRIRLWGESHSPHQLVLVPQWGGATK